MGSRRAILLALVLAAAPAAAQEETRPPVARREETAEEREARERREFEAVLARLSAELSKIERLRATFVQRKYLEVFDDVVESRGTIALRAPDRLRWEYTSPIRTTLVVNGGRGLRERTSRRGETTRTVFALADDPITRLTAEQVFLWTRGDFAKARESYVLERRSERPLVVRAVPRAEAVREVVAAVDLTFAEDLRALTGVTLVEKGGARTEIEFRDVDTDPDLPDALFHVESPR